MYKYITNAKLSLFANYRSLKSALIIFPFVRKQLSLAIRRQFARFFAKSCRLMTSTWNLHEYLSRESGFLKILQEYRQFREKSHIFSCARVPLGFANMAPLGAPRGGARASDINARFTTGAAERESLRRLSSIFAILGLPPKRAEIAHFKKIPRMCAARRIFAFHATILFPKNLSLEKRRRNRRRSEDGNFWYCKSNNFVF